MKRHIFAGLITCAATAVAIPALPAVAQQERVLEEIVVLATKREENIMDVPVAVTAVTSAELQASGIKDVVDMQANVPGLIVGQSQTSTTSNFAIRGVGSTSNNFGVESSVGLYVDGVYRSRQSAMINELVDVQMVEVLRGPQGTLFGKNTASGAIQVRTVAPTTDGTDGFIEVQGGDFGLIRIGAGANLVVSDNVALRGTLFSSQRDGYVDELGSGEDVLNDRDRIGGRLQLGYDNRDDFRMRIIADYSEIDENCCATLTLVDGLYSRASLAGIPQPGSDAAIAFLGGTIFTDFPYPQPLIDLINNDPTTQFFGGEVVTGVSFDDYVTSYNMLPRSENEDSGLSLEINKDLANGATLTSITAYRQFETRDSIDADFTDVDILGRINAADQDSISQEFRLSGDFGQGSKYVVGAYYFAQEIESQTDTPGGLFLNAYVEAVTPTVVQARQLVDLVAAQAGPPYAPSADAFPAGTFATDNVLQDHDGYAVFGEVEFALSNNFEATLGLRFTDESKSIDARYTHSAQGPAPNIDALLLEACKIDPSIPGCPPPGVLPPFDPTDPATFAIFNAFSQPGWGTYLFQPLAPRSDLFAELDDDQVTGNLKLTWFPSEAVMVYGSYSTGFKSGGTNTDRISPLLNPIFDAETSTSVELGLKGNWSSVRLSAAVYDTEFEDFQANTFTGTGFNVQNAGTLSVQGIEIEMLWRLLDNTEIQAFYAHNEGEYDQFRNGTCWDTFTFHTGIIDPGNTNPNPSLDDEICDKTGTVIPYNPEDRAFLAITQDFPVGNNVLFVRGEYSYASEAFTDGDTDPFTVLDDYNRVNLRAGLIIDSWNADITVWGRNVTDERSWHGSFDAPLQAGRMNAYPDEPRTWGVTFRKNFD